MPLVAAVAVIIILVIAAVASREQRQETGEPEQRSPSSINAPLLPVPEVPCNRGLLLRGRLSDSLTAPTASTPPGRPWAGGPGTYFFLSTLQPVKNNHLLSLSPIGLAVSSPSAS